MRLPEIVWDTYGFARSAFVRGSVPAGQLIMSAEDFGHYLIAQLNEGSYQDNPVLSPAGIAALH
jgi:hypothetical protein